MNEEQAIKVLSDYDGYFIGHSSDEVNEALDMAISALKGGWIPIVTRPMTEEERKEYMAHDYCMIPDYLTGEDALEIFDCPLPDDGEEVEVTIYGRIVVDTFYSDSVEGCYFDSVDIEDVTAWRRCEPYKKGE